MTVSLQPSVILANVAGSLVIRTCQYVKNTGILNVHNTTVLKELCKITFIKEEKNELFGILNRICQRKARECDFFFLFFKEHGEQILAVLCFQIRSWRQVNARQHTHQHHTGKILRESALLD